jgi:hypothetical protein
MHTIRTLTLAILATLAPLAARADTAPADRCAADLAAAKTNLVQAGHAMAKANQEMDPDRYNVAAQLADAALAQYRATRALCTTKLEKKVSPFASEADPFGPAKVAAPVWHEPVPVPGIPYLMEPSVAESCPGSDCPVVSLAAPVDAEVDADKPARW